MPVMTYADAVYDFIAVSYRFFSSSACLSNFYSKYQFFCARECSSTNLLIRVLSNLPLLRQMLSKFPETHIRVCSLFSSSKGRIGLEYSYTGDLRA